MSIPNSAKPVGTKPDMMARARTVSRLMAIVCGAICLLLPAAIAAFWLTASWPDIFTAAGLADPARYKLTMVTRLGALGLSLLPIAILVWGLLRIRRTFAAFGAGHFFSENAVKTLRDFSLAILISSAIRPLVGGALTVWLTWNGPEGGRTLSIPIGSDLLLAILFSGTVFILAQILKQAIAIADENRQFV